MRRLSLIVLPLIATAAAAQTPPAVPGTPDPKAIAAGTYAIDPDHTQVTFEVDHMGFSIYRGLLSNASGSLTIDPAAPGKTTLSVTVPVASIHSTSAKLDGELVSADWLDAARFPQASFVATGATVQPNDVVAVAGKLTLHGVTRPETLLVRFHGVGTNPMDKAATIGFDGRMVLRRSDFGVSKYVPLVSDRVVLTIAAAFEKR